MECREWLTRSQSIRFLTLATASLLFTGCSRATPEAVIGGEPISSTELNDALRLDRGIPILQRLVLEHAIIQEARKNKLSLDDADLKPYRAQMGEHIKDPALRRVAEQELVARLYLRLLLLKDSPTARLRELYDMFKDELTQYDLYAMVTTNKQQADKAVAALKANFPFPDQFEKFSNDRQFKKTRGHLGFLSLSQIAGSLGPDVAESVAKLDDSGLAPIFRGRNGFLVLKLGHVRSTFAELRTRVQDLIVEAGAPIYIATLEQNSKVSSRYFKDPALMPVMPMLEESIYKSVHEEGPSEVDASATPIISGHLGDKVGADLGVAVPATDVTETPKAASVIGADVGADMGLKVPTIDAPARTP